MSSFQIDSASFRDFSGFIFTSNGEVYRAISPEYSENFSELINSRLYQKLSEKKLLITHTNVENYLPKEYSEYKIIKPAKIPFISYPYEWSFSQLKSAALLTLNILQESLKQGMSLKDASAYNVQFS